MLVFNRIFIFNIDLNIKLKKNVKNLLKVNFIYFKMKGFEYILNNPDKNWNWYCISKNKNVSWDFIKTHIHNKSVYPWNSQGLAHNPNITYEIITENYDILKNKICMYSVNAMKKMDFSDPNITNYIVSYECLSSNPFLDFAFVDKQLNFQSQDWDWKQLSKNPNITKWFIDKHFDKLYIKKLIKNVAFTYTMLKDLLKFRNFEQGSELYSIAKNPNFTIKWYRLVNKYNINLHKVVSHKNVSMEDIVDHGLQNVFGVDENPNITIDHIRKYSGVNKKDLENLCKNPGVTWTMMYNTKDEFLWIARYITYNPTITWDDIKKNKHLDWDWDYISMKFDISKENLNDFPFNFKYLSMNPNINWDLVTKYSDKSWNWDYLVTNPMIL